jgi:hypothetical protein
MHEDKNTERKIEAAKERLLDAVEELAELGWNEDRITGECAYACEIARDDGVLK